ncbi:MAG: N-acetylglucosaminyldiphosphodolichol N-acetylglucosaminyltransferase catalytic subunit alg13 [Trizodia sp. TS-e1964]|nr:MAG: N-acetylglucosaminyldiphosphodolichol N-acetylglucosaminyltransferase catalytic subunit alg13 [Trizodia sp. TS-e1964]
MALKKSPRLTKLCFVTIGATASFNALISAVLTQRFLGTLRDCGYTHLILQYGSEGKAHLERFKDSTTSEEQACGINIDGFDFKNDGLAQEMKSARGREGVGVEGVVISHAGAGSILDALRMAVPLVVVPNPTLLDNHQVELAEELERQGYVIHGDLNDLSSAILRSEELRKGPKKWPPASERSGLSGRDLAGVMDDEMGFLD